MRSPREAAALVVLPLLLAAADTAAQTPTSPPPKPGPRFDVNGDGLGDALLGGALYLGARDAKLVAARAPGATCVPAGDVNGDGFSDVLAIEQRGKAIALHLGSAAGLAAAPATVLEPPSPTRTFGASAAAAGDVNHDGFGDVIIGAPGLMEAYVYLGARAGLAAKPAVTLKRTSRHEHSSFGDVVGGAGDLNGDGFADVLVRAPGPNKLYLFAGGAQGVSGEPLLEWFGGGDTQFPSEICAPGDVDGDGLADIAFTTELPDSNTHAPTLVRGRRGPLKPDAKSATVPGYDDGDVALWPAGDVNGDGYADLLLFPFGEPKLILMPGGKGGLSGKPRALPLGGELDTLSAGNDLNGDGYADLLVRLKGGKDVRLFPGGPKGFGKGARVGR